jgi:hypothetical protein
MRHTCALVLGATLTEERIILRRRKVSCLHFEQHYMNENKSYLFQREHQIFETTRIWAKSNICLCWGWSELFRLLGYYAEYGGLKLTFRDYILVPSSNGQGVSWLLMMGPLGSPETSVLNHVTLRNNPEDRKIKHLSVPSPELRLISHCVIYIRSIWALFWNFCGNQLSQS